MSQIKKNIVMSFANESEALLALISLALSADKVATEPERDYLFDRVSHLDILRDLSQEEFSRVMSSVNEQLFGSHDAYDQLMHENGIAEFCEAFQAVFPAEKTTDAFRMACEIACADGLVHIERDLIESLGAGLGIAQGQVAGILQEAELSFQ